MSKKYNIEHVRSFYKNAGYTLIDDKYVNYNANMTSIDSNGYKYYASLSTLRNSKRLRMVSKHNPYSIENIKLWLNHNNIPYTLLSTKYNDNGSKNRENSLLEFCCENGHIFYRTWNDVSGGQIRCEECSRRFTNHDQFVSYINEKYNGEYEILGDYINSATKIKVRHMSCGTVFDTIPESLANGHGCPNSFCCKKRGKDHYRYNENLTDEERSVDRKWKKEYRDWRSSVYRNYNYTCDICGCKRSKGNKIVAHHIESFDINEELRYDPSNGVALCERCHKDFHIKYGFGKNTSEQYCEYKNNQDNIEVKHQIA